MNWEMAKEVGIVTYLWKRVAWRIIQLTGNGVTMFPLPCGSVIRLPHSSPFASDIYCTGGRVDWGSEELMADYLKSMPKGVCYDIGANMGYYSVLLSPLAKEVVAFEPDPRNHEALLAQKIPNLTLVAKAVAEHPGTVEFDVSDASTVGHIRLEHQEGQSIKVEAVSLDEYSKGRDSTEVVRAVKMDVEGFEMEVFSGCDLKRWAPSLILIEDHVHDLQKHRHLVSQGYKLVNRLGCNSWYIPAHQHWSGPCQLTAFERLRKYYLALPLRKLKLFLKSRSFGH